ncbi:MAG: alpha/beta hydrolase [Gammaproteobacteria bacterium]|nr:alpha/beta hydrolase [Gammaproteobacteria bacterium]
MPLSIRTFILLVLFFTCTAEAEIVPKNNKTDIQSFNFDSQNQPVTMAYRWYKGLKNQPTILLLHGKNFNGDYWLDIADTLHRQGFSVLIPDQLGFGRSSKPAQYQFSFQALATNTHRLLNQLGISQAVVVGHSMGGMLAVRYALMYPNSVAKLVLENPLGLEDYLAHIDYQDVSVFYRSERNKTLDSVRAYQQKNYYDGNWSPKFEATLALTREQLNSDQWPNIARINAQTYDMIFTGPIIYELERLSMPTYLIYGLRDRTAPGRAWQNDRQSYTLGQFKQLAQNAVKRLPKGKGYPLENIGHLPHIEAPQQFKNLLNEILTHPILQIKSEANK